MYKCLIATGCRLKYNNGKGVAIMKLLISILLPLVVGGVSGALTADHVAVYETLIKPSLAPAPLVFPIVWTILYILMGISSYKIYTAEAEQGVKKRALILYALQLAVNFIWPIVFFNQQNYGAALILLLFLIVLVVETILAFYPIDKAAAWLLVPYLVWLCFAAYLNLSIWMFN